MKAPMACVLTLNGGSSSIRFALYGVGRSPLLRLSGKIDRIGTPGASLVVKDSRTQEEAAHTLTAAERRRPAAFLLDWLEARAAFRSIRAVGHRVVHGMTRSAPARVTPGVLAELRRTIPYDPDHMPGEIRLIEEVRRRHPKMRQVVCFDTAFHRTMPRLARLLAIPRRYARKGVERYGFHGLSYAFLMEELGRVDPQGARGKVVLAHLGNGASIAAVRDGRSLDTSMGFTPASGLVMGTRSGDLDPGLAYYLARTQRMTPSGFRTMTNERAGMLGVSGTSADFRTLLEHEASDERAADATGLFCYQAKKWIGAYAAALGGIDTLVFAGGIGENAPVARQRICQDLGFLGIEIVSSQNARNAPLISAPRARVKVRVIRTNEELMIARAVIRTLKLAPGL
jgi:acetate kinase